MSTFPVLISTSYGGFGLSSAAIQWLNRKGHPLAVAQWQEVIAGYGRTSYLSDIQRDDPMIIECVRAIGLKEAGSQHAHLEIMEVPMGSNWDVDCDDGKESLHHWPRNVASGR